MQLSEDGTVFYVVVPDGAIAPTVAEVMNGTASGGYAPLACGETYVVANTPKAQTVANIDCWDEVRPPPKRSASPFPWAAHLKRCACRSTHMLELWHATGAMCASRWWTASGKMGTEFISCPQVTRRVRAVSQLAQSHFYGLSDVPTPPPGPRCSSCPQISEATGYDLMAYPDGNTT